MYIGAAKKYFRKKMEKHPYANLILIKRSCLAHIVKQSSIKSYLLYYRPIHLVLHKVKPSDLQESISNIMFSLTFDEALRQQCRYLIPRYQWFYLVIFKITRMSSFLPLSYWYFQNKDNQSKPLILSRIMGRFGSVLPACFIRRLEKRTTNTYESNISSFVPRCQAKLNELTH